MFPYTKIRHILMFTNTKFRLDIARNVSTIDITIYGRGATRHDATIVQTQNFASQKEIQHFKNFHKNFLLPINKFYLYSHSCQANHE